MRLLTQSRNTFIRFMTANSARFARSLPLVEEGSDMGRIDPRLIPDWFRDHGDALLDPDLSVPAGTKKKVEQVYATSITLSKDLTVAYGKEVPFQAIRGCPLDLPPEIADLLGIQRMFAWLVYTSQTKYQGHTIVVADLPA